MTSLEELRTQLSDVDDQITDLYEKRMKICEDLGTCKIKNGYKTFDRQREKNKIAEVMGKVSSDFNKKGIGEVYELLLAISRKLQYKQLVEAGALGRLPFIGIDSLDKEAMEAIEEGAADYAVLPIENSTAGAVNEIYDLLVEFENYIVGETIIPIKNTLSGLPGTDISEIERVYSKAEALMQASHFLGEHGDWQQISVANTALAAKKILEDQDKHQAAVCSAYAASVYGLSVLADSINDEKNNSTRFIVITNQKVFLKDAKKISICLELPHESSSLYHLLSHFAYNDLNMTKIESRPMEGKSWEYRFFIDFEGNLADPAVKNAIRGLREEGRNLRILGNY